MDVHVYYSHSIVKELYSYVMLCAVNEPRWAAAGVQYPAG
jgi:hypothetical protein